MKPFRFTCYLCLAGSMLLGAAAHAETFTFGFTATANFFTASGTLTAVADPTTPNVFDVTAISGTINGSTITGLLSCAAYDPANPCTSTGNSFQYDNLLYPEGIPTGIHQVLDYSGIGFALDSGLDGEFSAEYTHFYQYDNNAAPHSDQETVAFAITPEPASFVLLGTGLLGIAGAVRRRIAT